ncbi:hypothetical protein [Salibaculum griseiflavum]|uniref:hypothetical protein n=1 Tax=Salibaculum griseiflavum TaxID=1914409 RepID=UPI0011B1DA98|nr:hypothetical protein [Salibaculum griseiflavum]
MTDSKAKLTADEAIERAFALFARFVQRDTNLSNVLLEQLEPTDEGWLVSIGFDGKRQEISEPSSTGAMAALSGFGQKTTKTVREVRHFHLGEEGEFLRMS